MLSTTTALMYFYDQQAATGGERDPLCHACQRAFNKNQPMIRATYRPIATTVEASPGTDIEAHHVHCWRRTRLDNGDYHDDADYDERPGLTYADCGHPVMPRGTRPGLITLHPVRRGTLCHCCADNLERFALADLLTMTYNAYRNGDTILTAQGGKLATVTTIAAAERTAAGHVLWITGLTGRVWTAPVPAPAYLGPVTLHAYPGSQIPPHVPMPPANHHTVFSDDKVVVKYNDYAVTVLATTPEHVTVGYGRTVNSMTDTLPWAQVRRYHERPCCIGLSHLCRCVNRVGECPLPGCNDRATAWIDRVEAPTYDNVYPEKVCQGHYDLLITRPGWSAPARAA